MPYAKPHYKRKFSPNKTPSAHWKPRRQSKGSGLELTLVKARLARVRCPTLNSTPIDVEHDHVFTDNDSYGGPDGPVLLTKKQRKFQSVEEVTSMPDKRKKENEDAIMESLELQQAPGRTHLIAVATYNAQSDGSNANQPRQIRCYHGHAFYEGYPYDQGNDCYLISCVDSKELGAIPIAYQLTMPVSGAWTVQIPLPEKVVRRYMDATQKSALAQFGEKYSSKSYTIQIMQMAGCEV